MTNSDMGKSFVSRRNVYDAFVPRLPATMALMLSPVLLTMASAPPLRILSATPYNQLADYLIRFFSFIGNSMPIFFAAMVLIYVLRNRLNRLPVITSRNLAESIVLPALMLTLSTGRHSDHGRLAAYSGRPLLQRKGCEISAISEPFVFKNHFR